MELKLLGQNITAVSREQGLTIRTDEQFELQADSLFVLHQPDSGELRVSPHGDEASPDELNTLVGHRITSSEADDTTGALVLEFDNGARLDIDADPENEAWTIVGTDGYRVVCRPGGEVVPWQA